MASCGHATTLPRPFAALPPPTGSAPPRWDVRRPAVDTDERLSDQRDPVQRARPVAFAGWLRVRKGTHCIRPSFAGRWSISFVPDLTLTILRASLSRPATPFAPGWPKTRLCPRRKRGRQNPPASAPQTDTRRKPPHLESGSGTPKDSVENWTRRPQAGFTFAVGSILGQRFPGGPRRLGMSLSRDLRQSFGSDCRGAPTPDCCADSVHQLLQNARIGGYHAFVAAKLVVHSGIPDRLGLTAADDAKKLQFQMNVFWLKAARIVPKGGPRRDT